MCFFAAVFFPFFLIAEASKLPEVPSKSEAIAIIAAEGHARELKEAHHKATLEAVPASKEWEVDHGDRKAVIRRIAPPPARVIARSKTSINRTSDVPIWTEEEIDAWLAEQAISRTLHLSATVYDRRFTKISWRDEHQQEWTILSNIDFRYLSGIGSFDDDRHHWMTFLFVHEVDTAREAETVRLAAEKGLRYKARNIDHLLTLAPPDFFAAPPLRNSETSSLSPLPFYFIITESEASPIPDALYEELDALHQFYHDNEERLIVEYERRKVMNEARRAWREANPPEPKDTVINFWKVE